MDTRQLTGQFIFSGSATGHEDLTRHSGAGRFARVAMRPMSLYEARLGTGEISLGGLDNKTPIQATSPVTYKDMARFAVTGGWPGLLSASTRQALLFNRSYLDNLCNTEISQATQVRHDCVRMRRLLESIARNVSGEATIENLAKDVSGDGGVVSAKTISNYMDALSTVFGLDVLPAWSVALRSRSRLRTSAKLHLADPALACAALGAGVDRLAGDPLFFGQIFESMVIRDLRALVGICQRGNCFVFTAFTPAA